MPSALLLPVLTCAAVLLVSGVAKLRAPRTVDAAFTSLEVPRALDTTFVRRLSPWAEVALGIGLLLATGRALVAVAALTLVLFVAYLVLVVRAVRRPEPVDCGCFGALGASRVTRVTVWRNGALVLTAALCVVAGLRGVGLVGAVVDGGALAWVATATLTAAVAVLVAYREPVTTSSSAGPHHDPDASYERQRTPQAEVLTQEGRLVLLSNETATAAHLLVFLSPGCGPCARIGPDLAEWSEQLDPVVVRAVVIAQPQSGSAMPYLTGHAWYDPYGMARTAFGVATPAAVLLGTDGMLAGGPVQGEDDVRALVTELAEHLREVRAAGQPLGSEREGVSDAR
jgi:thiol-disulfide isomerase/thioredoxin